MFFCNALDYFVLIVYWRKRLHDLKEFDWSFDTVAEWLSAAEAKVSSFAASVPSSAADARAVLNDCRVCWQEMSCKQHSLECLTATVHSLHRGEDSTPHSSVFQLNSRYSLITTKLKVRVLITQLQSLNDSVCKLDCLYRLYHCS